MSDSQDIRYLLERYIEQTATRKEKDRLFEMLLEHAEEPEWQQAMQELMEKETTGYSYEPLRWEPVIKKIINQRDQREIKKGKKRKLIIRRTLAAAAFFFLMGMGIWFLMQEWNYKHRRETAGINIENKDITPGGNKAVLVLANGKRLVLDSLQNGIVTRQGNARIIKQSNGQLFYKTQPGSEREFSPVLNTIYTPKGGVFRLVLPDGTKVWLNAASSIKFPTAFSGKYRRVQITGEVFFDVEKNASHPFIVEAKPALDESDPVEIKVLGTQFNIMAYREEKGIKTTLLEGAVELYKGADKVKLLPGQQALVKPESRIKTNEMPESIQVINNVNVSKTIAWKNGFFQFADDNIENVLRQIARWYNVEIEYKDKIPEGHITGKIPLQTNLSDVLKILKWSGVAFQIEGRKVVISEK